MAVVVGLHDHAADDVGGHQIGRELDAGVAQAQGAREGAQQRGLAEAGDAFQQHVAGREQADQNAIDDALLADDDFGDFVADLVEFGDRRARGGFNGHEFDSSGSYVAFVSIDIIAQINSGRGAALAVSVKMSVR